MISYINQLKVFDSVARLESLTKAARELNVTPPAINKQLRTLEEILDLKLFYREGKKIKLTPLGTDIHRRSSKVFSELKELGNYLNDLSSIKAGTLKVGFPDTITKGLIIPLIEIYQKSHPEIKLILMQGSSLELVNGVLDRKLDIAITGRISDIDNDKLKFIETPNKGCLALISSLDFPVPDKISIKDLADEPLIVPQKGSATRSALNDHFEKIGVKLNIFVETSSMDFAKEMVLQGKGLAFVSKVSVLNDLKNKTLKAIDIIEGLPEIRRGFIFHKNVALSPAAQSFLEIIDEIEGIETALIE